MFHMFPSQVPSSLISRVARVVGNSECVEVVFDSSLGMEPIVLVFAAPWSLPLPITTVILSKEEALRALGVVLSTDWQKQAIWFTDSSLLDGKAGGWNGDGEDGGTAG